MTNLVRVFNLTTKRNRIYSVPADPATDEFFTLKRGDLVSVEIGDDGSTALGVVKSDSTLVTDDELVKIRKDWLGLNPEGTFKRVVAIYNKYDLYKDDEEGADVVDEEESEDLELVEG